MTYVPTDVALGTNDIHYVSIYHTRVAVVWVRFQRIPIIPVITK